MSQPMMFNPSFGMMSSPAYQMPSGGSGYGGSGYGGSGMSAMSSGGYSPSQMPYGGNNSYSPSSYAPAQTSQVPRVPTADDIEVSGPLNKAPPRRAIVRVRLPDTRGDIGFDGQKVDSMGRARTFVTPELSGPRTFEVTATWKKKGRTVWLMEMVTVNAGQIRTLDFTSGK
jgi:uncharacterized protein (TIGR03000 family)